MIKFRAWHKKKHMMFAVTAINFTDEIVDLIGTAKMVDGTPCIITEASSLSDVELIQCIGLTDRDDIDIYHKDILRHYQTNECYIIEHIDEAARFAIRKIGCNTEAGYMLVQDNMHMFEVVSNFYLHPDCLDADCAGVSVLNTEGWK